MDNLCTYCKFLYLSRDTVIKPCPYGKEDIAVANCPICRIAAMNPYVAYIQNMRCRDCSFSHDGSDDGNARLLRKLCHFFVCMGNIHSATYEKNRPFRMAQNIERLI